MREIQSVVVLGAGAVGAFFATRFFETEGFSSAVIARGERYERLKKDGLTVNGVHYDVPVIHPDMATEPADLIIVALKHHHLAEAVPDLENVVGDDTIIISVMNGLVSEEIIGSVYGMDKMLHCITVGIEALRVGNEVKCTPPGKHIFGEPDNTVLSEKVKRVQRAFERAEITYETPEDMMRVMWWKFMINVGMNQSSAVMRANYGVYQTSMDARALMRSLMMEVVQLSKVAGVNLEEKDIDKWEGILGNFVPYGKTSMLQDIEGGRKTEVEIFGGTVVDMGKKYSIPTPVNQAVVHAITVLEQYSAR